ncbi:MAG: cell division protein ZapA [Blastocatellia bacterium]|jgi:cell division protein ZapA|nr:cell division protein ZapA [Blastocatellia bacterium]
MNQGNGLRLDKNNIDAAPTIRVEIYNQTYNIRSDGDSDYISELANYVDSRMREISSGTLTVDSLKVAILAALYIADELHRLKNVHEQADEQLASRSSECAEMLDRLLKFRSSVERQQPGGAGSIVFS